MARSEANAFLNKSTYSDLNLTRYPENIDSRLSEDSGYNVNMKGFENLTDYNMAEHVNALSDAVMALQRALGITPYIDTDGTTHGDVSARIKTVEDRNFDSRYGGIGWDTSQTLVGHTHNGAGGGPGKIDLSTEVKNQLGSDRILKDYTDPNGLTGEELKVSHQENLTINKAITDRLSKTEGGYVEGKVTFGNTIEHGGFLQRGPRDAVAGTIINTYTTNTNESVKKTGITSSKMFRINSSEIAYGKYVMSVRAKIDTATSENVMRMESYNNISSTNSEGYEWKRRNFKQISGDDFDSVGTWQMFYLVFDHEGDMENTILHMNVWHLANDSGSGLEIDTVTVMPVHPAIYDR